MEKPGNQDEKQINSGKYYSYDFQYQNNEETEDRTENIRDPNVWAA